MIFINSLINISYQKHRGVHIGLNSLLNATLPYELSNATFEPPYHVFTLKHLKKILPIVKEYPPLQDEFMTKIQKLKNVGQLLYIFTFQLI